MKSAQVISEAQVNQSSLTKDFLMIHKKLFTVNRQGRRPKMTHLCGNQSLLSLQAIKTTVVYGGWLIKYFLAQ